MSPRIESKKGDEQVRISEASRPNKVIQSESRNAKKQVQKSAKVVIKGN